MREICDKLKLFIEAYLPHLGRIMLQKGVEVDFFAQTWFITLLFHFSMDSSIQTRKKKTVNLEC